MEVRCLVGRSRADSEAQHPAATATIAPSGVRQRSLIAIVLVAEHVPVDKITVEVAGIE